MRRRCEEFSSCILPFSRIDHFRALPFPEEDTNFTHDEVLEATASRRNRSLFAENMSEMSVFLLLATTVIGLVWSICVFNWLECFFVKL